MDCLSYRGVSRMVMHSSYARLGLLHQY